MEVTKDDIKTMQILFGADINELCNQRRWKDAKEMESIRDRLTKALEQDLPSDLGEGKLALLEKTYNDFFKCKSGEGWLKIDGKEYSTDIGYALDGIRIFMEVYRKRLAESEDVK